MEKGLKYLTSTGRSAARREKPIETAPKQDEFNDSGFHDESYSSRGTVSNESSLSFFGPPVPQPTYQPISQQPQPYYQHYPHQHQHQQCIPSIESLLARSSRPNLNPTVRTTDGEDSLWPAEDCE